MSSKFKDTKGREWKISLTYGDLDTIAEETGEDILMDPTKIKLDPRTWIDMLWIIIEDQAEACHVTDVDFGRSMNGATLQVAMDAFMEELINFFSPLHPAQAEVMKKVWSAIREVKEGERDMVRAILERPSSDLLESLELSLGDTNSGSLSSKPMEPAPNSGKRKRRGRKRRKR